MTRNLSLPIQHRTAPLRSKPAGQLLVHEIYRSLQGESTFAGLPCVFVRLSVCDSRCKWCFVPETSILMADWSWRPLGELKPSDQVLSVSRQDPIPFSKRKLIPATVTRVSRRKAPTMLVNGRLRCTADHQFWRVRQQATGRTAHDGWREVSRCVGDDVQFVAEPPDWPAESPSYSRGWLAGVADGDGCFWSLRKGGHLYRRFRLAVEDADILNTFLARARTHGFELRRGRHRKVGYCGPAEMDCLWLTQSETAGRFEALLAEDQSDKAWWAGYLGGIFDAEGSISQRTLRLAQSRTVNPLTCERIEKALCQLGFSYKPEPKAIYVGRDDGLQWQFLSLAHPILARKRDKALGSVVTHRRKIERVEPASDMEEVVTLTTTSGSFIAGGYVVKNCDTPHAFTEGRPMTPEAVLAEVERHDCPLVEFTGGEPLLQPEVLPLMTAVADRGRTVLLETSGAHDVRPVDPRVHIIMDLKCPDSGECERNHWPNLDALKPTDQIKFVLASRRDFDWTEATVRQHQLDRRFTVLLSAVFGSAELVELAEWLLASGLNVRMQLQMHKYIWGPQTRGV
jgi:7-carboxy-7-deazaguanine synthase